MRGCAPGRGRGPLRGCAPGRRSRAGARYGRAAPAAEAASGGPRRAIPARARPGIAKQARRRPAPTPRTCARRGSRPRAYLLLGLTNSLRATLTASAIAAMCTTTPTMDASMTSSKILQLMANAESDGASTISATAVPRSSSVLVESPAPPPPPAPNVARTAPAAIKTKSAGASGHPPAPPLRGRRARGAPGRP